MRHAKTSLRPCQRRAIASMLAMLYLVLFSVLAVGFYASTGTAGQVSANEQRRYRSLGSAESGMDFMHFQLFQTSVLPSTTADQLLTQIYNDLAFQLNGTPNMGAKTVGINITNTQIDIPSQPDQYIKLGSDGAKFRCVITRPALPAGNRSIVVKVIGCYADSSLGNADRAAVQLRYDPLERPTDFFDIGMASKGTVTIDVKNPIIGVPASEASIMSLSTVNPPVTLMSGSSISGDITTVGGLNPSLAAGVSVGGTAIMADILANHVHHADPLLLPEMPTPDTSVYAKYATTMYVAGKPSYDNVYIPANLNPTISGPITFRGVLLIKSPNNVKFNGGVNFQGVVVSDNSGVGTLLTNVITFTGSGNTTSGLETLPDLPQFHELREMGGSFVIAPGYDVKFTGNFSAISGNIVGDRINVQGSSDLAINGSVVALKNTLTMGTNGVLTFKPNPSGLHTGLRFSDRWVPSMATYDEVKP